MTRPARRTDGARHQAASEWCACSRRLVQLSCVWLTTGVTLGCGGAGILLATVVKQQLLIARTRDMGGHAVADASQPLVHKLASYSFRQSC
jgi:hypothetical protein